jgi:hypothetical protein
MKSRLARKNCTNAWSLQQVWAKSLLSSERFFQAVTLMLTGFSLRTNYRIKRYQVRRELLIYNTLNYTIRRSKVLKWKRPDRLEASQRSAASSGGSMGLSWCLTMGTSQQRCLSDQQSVRFWYDQLVILGFHFAFTLYRILRFDRPA